MEIKTDRLIIREMNENDFDSLYFVLADSDIMKHYPYTFDEKRVKGWIDKNVERYKTFGFGLWAVCLKETGEMIGDCGLTMQNINGSIKPEIGYHIRAIYQRKGYAKEAARAVRDWAFINTPFNEIYSYMKSTNVASINTALAYGCRKVDEFKDEEDEVTNVYSVTRNEWKKDYVFEDETLRLRPYKPCDAKNIVTWFTDEIMFNKWSANRWDEYPLTAEMMNDKYIRNNGDCVEEDNFYPMTLVDIEEDCPVGSLILRYTNDEKTTIRFGFIVVDTSKRGKGYGKKMLLLAKKYAFEILKAKKVTLGVFENNPSAYHCYKSVGFNECLTEEAVYYDIMNEKWKCLEMETFKSY